jgi:hypothetical protein
MFSNLLFLRSFASKLSVCLSSLLIFAFEAKVWTTASELMSDVVFSVNRKIDYRNDLSHLRTLELGTMEIPLDVSHINQPSLRRKLQKSLNGKDI